MIGVLRNTSEGAQPKRATVVLSTSEIQRFPQPTPKVKWTGRESDRQIKSKLKLEKRLAKKNQPPSAHAVQGGLPELGRRR